MNSYRDLKVWQKARVLASDIYRATSRFPQSEMFGLAQQLRRAVVSTACNIAEGQGRWSHREQMNFYFIARGSTLEIQTQLVIANDLGYVDEATLDSLLNQADEIGRMLNGLIKSVRSKLQTPSPKH